jgi:hypothetical protein
MFTKRSRQATVAEDGDKLWAQAKKAHEKGDEKKAFELYQRAATAGSIRALNSVGVCYMTGFGLKKKTTDPVRAVEFYVFSERSRARRRQRHGELGKRVSQRRRCREKGREGSL